jgi:ribonuclease HI
MKPTAPDYVCAVCRHARWLDGEEKRGPAAGPSRRSRPPTALADLEQIVVYTDGACSGNPGPGGWAWVIPDGPRDSGGEAHTTNQKMELAAVLRALEQLAPTGLPLTVVSDSAYVVGCFHERWYEKWNRRDWRNVKNPELWKPLVALAVEHDVRFVKVKGHSGDRGNELANELATKAAAGARPGAAELGERGVGARAAAPPHQPTGQCEGTTKKGTPCRAGAQRGSRYCPHHQPL